VCTKGDGKVSLICTEPEREKKNNEKKLKNKNGYSSEGMVRGTQAKV